MAKSKKSIKSGVCAGCLCSDRKLEQIAPFYRLYTMLMEDVLGEKITLKKIPSMCMECRKILRSAKKFQRRAKEAYKSLVLKIDSRKKVINNSNTNHSVTPIPDDVIKLNPERKSETIVSTTTQDGVKNEFECTLEKIKEENEFDVKIENEYVDTDSINDDADFTEHNDETTVKEETNNVIDKKISKRKKVRPRDKYKIIRKVDGQGLNDLCLAVKIDEEERQRCMAFERTSAEYLKFNYNCDKCIVGFNSKRLLEKHLKNYHSESNPYECEVCNARVVAKHLFLKHTKAHSLKYVCSLCNYERLSKKTVYGHLSREHRVAYECQECGLRFLEYREFYRHYNNVHRYFVCDHCGFRGTTKNRLINHIRINHSEHICKYCNKKYVKYHSMTRHIAFRHTKEVSEESYCVECNMQFDNITLYRRHLRTSIKHRPKIVFPCTECPNVYAKKTTMINHYKYIHLQKTDYYCDKCSRYFLNGFRLRTHIATYHNNIQAPKNKICSYCGRGFVTNRILDNHIRTHTGERPFACTHCTATFAQKSALVTHARAIHKVIMRYTTKE